MRIVLISPYFSEGMGYLENCLPKALVTLGHEVHVVTSTGQVYFNQPKYNQIYEKFLGECIVDPGIKEINGFVLQRLTFRLISGKVFLTGLYSKLKEIKPDVVQTFDPFSFLNIQVILYKFFMKYKVFTANHIMESVFPLAHIGKNRKVWKRVHFYFTRTLPGKVFNRFIEKSFPITIDAKEIAARYYSVPYHKMRIIPLGVDTQLFQPAESRQMQKKRLEMRMEAGIMENEILCIYSGRFSEGKNPLCLAHAIHKLRSMKEPYKGLFIGNGLQAEQIEKLEGCIVRDFVLFNDLADFYRMADIGVWPREESTSMLDAAASGLPLVISNTVQAIERIENNGLTYIENDVDDMVKVLLQLKDEKARKQFAINGVEKMKNNYSWIRMAEVRIEEYNKALN
ncbi:MAG: glycosyltransferase family 4 protein [Bacteroidales bacterium]|nr:MAG: glycosyltransferase family 4 protein [Bacteroidales bacterium]